MRLIDADELRRALPMAAAIDALEAAFRERDPAGDPIRTHVDTPAGSLLLMPATSALGVGVKLVTLTSGNPGRGLPLIGAVYVLFDPATQAPEAVIDGAALTALRTAAVSGVATRWLANPEADRLVIFGAGVQARSHLDAMLDVRPIRRVTVVTRSRGPADALIAMVRAKGVDASAGGPEAIADADLVCTCTTSDDPVFDGALMPPGIHVTAVGAYRPTTRELDTTSMERARVVVETREAAFEEAGELAIPIANGSFGPEHVVADLRELVRGREVRTSSNDVTVFKSVGLGFEDLVVARAIVDAA